MQSTKKIWKNLSGHNLKGCSMQALNVFIGIVKCLNNINYFPTRYLIYIFLLILNAESVREYRYLHLFQVNSSFETYSLLSTYQPIRKQFQISVV